MFVVIFYFLAVVACQSFTVTFSVREPSLSSAMSTLMCSSGNSSSISSGHSMKQYLRYFAVEFKNHREIENEIYHGRSFILYRYHCTSAGY